MKLTRLEARARLIRGSERVTLAVFCMAIGFVVVATAFPQRRELERLEAKLAQARTLEQNVREDEEYHRIEYQALREDPAFLELHARDRLDYYREGERIFKFRRD